MTSAAVLANPDARRRSSEGANSAGRGIHPPRAQGRIMATRTAALVAHSLITNAWDMLDLPPARVRRPVSTVNKVRTRPRTANVITPQSRSTDARKSGTNRGIEYAVKTHRVPDRRYTAVARELANRRCMSESM